MKKILLSFAAIVLIALGAFLVLNKQKSAEKVASRMPTPSEKGVGTNITAVVRKDTVVGTGLEANPGDKISVHYTGWLDNGEKTDSSRDRGKPFEFVLGAGQVIRGWDQGIIGMRVGGKRQLTIPPELGYGAAGAEGVVPPNAVLHYDFELLKVEPRQAASAKK